MRQWRAILAGGCCACGLFMSLRAAAAPAPDAPSPQTNSQVQDLIRQLGDDDFRARESAAEKLRALGPDAVPALKEAVRNGGDPEVSARADAIIRHAEQPRVPRAFLRLDGGPGQQVRVSIGVNGGRVVEVRDEEGRRLRVVDGPAGVELELSGEGADPSPLRFRARSAEELRRTAPDAYRLYEQWADGGMQAGAQFRARRLPRARLLPMAPLGGLPRPPADDLLDLELRLRRNMLQAGVPPQQQQDVLELMRQMRRMQDEGRMLLEDNLDVRMEKYNLLSDALRKRLEALDLPDPGNALPPPAKARLGISVGTPLDADPLADPDDEGVTVTRVLPKSRGEQVGLKPGDVIRSVNGKQVNTTGGLRTAVTEAKGGLVVEVQRGEETVTLREKGD